MATTYTKALELKAALITEITYQEKVIENAGDCYDGHSQDLHDCKKLLNQLDEFLVSVERNRD